MKSADAGGCKDCCPLAKANRGPKCSLCDNDHGNHGKIRGWAKKEKKDADEARVPEGGSGGQNVRRQTGLKSSDDVGY